MREQVSGDSDELRQCALQAANPTNHAINFIALPECGDTGANLFDDTCHINSEHGRKRLLCMCCSAPADLGVERIHATGLDSD
jgi:hypothetical protein